MHFVAARNRSDGSSQEIVNEDRGPVIQPVVSCVGL